MVDGELMSTTFTGGRGGEKRKRLGFVECIGACVINERPWICLSQTAVYLDSDIVSFMLMSGIQINDKTHRLTEIIMETLYV